MPATSITADHAKKGGNVSSPSTASNKEPKDSNVSLPNPKSPNISPKKGFDYLGCALLLLLILVTIFTYPDLTTKKCTINQVWYYGWITAVSTGLGVIPFYFVAEPNKFWMGVSNGPFFFIIIIIILILPSFLFLLPVSH